MPCFYHQCGCQPVVQASTSWIKNDHQKSNEKNGSGKIFPKQSTGCLHEAHSFNFQVDHLDA